MIEPIRIAIRLPDSGYMGRVLLGAIRAAHARRWIVSPGENSPEFMVRYGMRGIIGAAGERPEPRLYAEAGIKFISVLGLMTPGCAGGVSIDHEHAGRLAGEHLLECGFRNFGFVGYVLHHGAARRRGFEKAVGQRARTISTCPVAYHNTTEDYQTMLAWLQALPKPAGVFTVDDPVGACVTEVCHLGGIRVPTDVAVVSVNDDGVHTLASEPELSSVGIPWEFIGSETVRLLAAHMSGDPHPPARIVVSPTGIVIRGSSDINVIGDTEVAAAVSFIRQHMHRAIGVDDVADGTMISRRLLERRFRNATGRTVLEQIQFTRVERAKKMLVETPMRVSDIAIACGFGSRTQFHRVFQKMLGNTPDEYRRNGNEVMTITADAREDPSPQAAISVSELTPSREHPETSPTQV